MSREEIKEKVSQIHELPYYIKMGDFLDDGKGSIQIIESEESEQRKHRKIGLYKPIIIRRYESI